MTRSPVWSAAAVAATPVDRDRYVDFLRLVSIVVVVLGHWTLVLVVLAGTTVGEHLAARLATWALMVMPLFFAVGGFVHGRMLGSPRRQRSYAEFVASRADRLLGPVIVMLAVWVALAVALQVLGLETGPIAVAADRAPTPLWFVAVYLLVILLAPATWVWHRRLGVGAFMIMTVAAVLVDVLRYRSGLDWAGSVNLLLVWVAVHQLGYLWASGTLIRRGVPAGLAIGGFGVAVLLTLVSGWYPVDMLGLPGSPDDNFSPPTTALLAHAVGLLGLALLLRRPVSVLLRRPRIWATTVVGNNVIMTVFCWHLTAAFLVVGALLLFGVALPPTLSPTWWTVLPVWFLACALVLTVLVVPLRRAERWSVLSGAPPTAASAATGVTLVALGLLVVSQVGLDGLLSGASERALGLPLTAAPALLALVVGLAVLAPGRRPVSLRPPQGSS
jgi:peptidoglycan/LPS O-acetylase OafA/YrhL